MRARRWLACAVVAVAVALGTVRTPAAETTAQDAINRWRDAVGGDATPGFTFLALARAGSEPVSIAFTVTLLSLEEL